MKIRIILEEKDVYEYLKDRNLITQYRKAKNYLLAGNSSNVLLRKRQPKSSGVYYFRINRQYRAIGYFDGDIFIVVQVDDHQ